MARLPLIDEGRLWNTLMELAEIGALPNGGVRRLAASAEDGQGRDLFVKWCREAGLAVRVDRIGNIFARREGRHPERPPVLMGSHLDTQPVGGKFDGMFGVLAALEVVRTLDDAGISTAAPIEIVNWTNEEGCRYQPSSLGAEVAAGHREIEASLAIHDEDGIALGDALERIGYLGEHPPSLQGAACYLEAHIEQGPILEEQEIAIGVVEGSMGVNAFEIALTGREAHTGTTPLLRRQDALFGAARCITEVRALGLAFEPAGRASVARLQVGPNARSVVASSAVFTSDCRHGAPAELATMTARLNEIVRTVSEECNLAATMKPYWSVPPRAFDAACLAAVRQAADDLGLTHMKMTSGAGHDAIPISAVVPTAMIFVPSKGGISHHQEEYTAPAQLAAGCNVLLGATVRLAG